MKETLRNYIERFKKRRHRKMKVVSILGVLSLFIALSVFWQLRIIGVTMTDEAYCGKKEHTHSEECIKRNLICGFDEEATSQEKSAEEFDESSAQRDNESLAEKEESHVHTEQCYETIYSCGYEEEHTHTLECYSDPKADIEKPQDWEATLPKKLTGKCAENFVSVAQSQLGYKESTANFKVDEGGSKKGYTRYGEWYGNPYGDWSGMFVSFCLHYAGYSKDEAPYHAGASAMRQAWASAELFHSKDEVQPEAGNLIFFSDDTVGIIASANGQSLNVIVGDHNDAVEAITVSADAANVLGYGVLPEEDATSVPKKTSVSNTANVVDEPLTQASTPQNIKDYVEQSGGHFDITILNPDGTDIPKDTNGNLIVIAGQDYKLSFGLFAHGIVPGSYYYQLPAGLSLNATNGVFKENGVEIGSWSVNEDGYIAFEFTEEANKYTNITIGASIGAVFNESEIPIEFDGNIKVVVKKPDTPIKETKVSKYGRGVQTDENGDIILDKDGDPVYVEKDFDRIEWKVEIQGSENSHIIGSELTDAIVTPKTQYYSDADIAAGISISFDGYAADGETIEWHRFTVHNGDPGLTWTPQGWTYTMPEEIICEYDWCSHRGKPTKLNNKWTYYVTYYTSVKDPDKIGYSVYENTVTIDHKTGKGWMNQISGDVKGEIIKNGFFNGTDGKFHWNISASIPAAQQGKKYTYTWYLYDSCKVNTPGSTDPKIDGTYLNRIESMTISYGGKNYNVPFVDDAGADDQFCYTYGWKNNGGNPEGCYYGAELMLGMRCQCTEDTCQVWDTQDNCCYAYSGSALQKRGFCNCWRLEEDATLSINYALDGAELIEKYGGMGYDYTNYVELSKLEKNSEGKFVVSNVDSNDDSVPIPGVFKKELLEQPGSTNGYIASYSITANESMLDLSDQDSVTILDTMSETLVYVPGTMKITTLDANGNHGELVYGTDYTLEYNAQKHQITIVLLKPGAMQYTLNYDAEIVLPPGQTSVKFENSASIELFGKTISSEQKPITVTEIVMSAKKYAVTVHKLATEESKPLLGAKFGLFAENGEQITTGTTAEDGEITFETSVSAGIILRDHQLYYIQELSAPDGYQLDKTKHWLFFCSEEEICDKCNEILSSENGKDAWRVEESSDHVIVLKNKKITYALPNTGGIGTMWYTFGGLLFLAAALMYGYRMRRKHKRREEQ